MHIFQTQSIQTVAGVQQLFPQLAAHVVIGSCTWRRTVRQNPCSQPNYTFVSVLIGGSKVQSRMQVHKCKQKYHGETPLQMQSIGNFFAHKVISFFFYLQEKLGFSSTCSVVVLGENKMKILAIALHLLYVWYWR